jgi:5-methylcytosine-specific restriction protein B
MPYDQALLEKAEFLRDVGITNDQTSRLHHRSLGGHRESINSTINWIRKNLGSEVREPNNSYHQRLAYLYYHLQGKEDGSGVPEDLVNEALRQFPLGEMGANNNASEHYEEQDAGGQISPVAYPLNTILYGPPGTGKTYATIDKALEILSPEFLAANLGNRSSLKAHFDSLITAGHVRFVTFHQSFCYEDFVEGLRAENDEDGQLRYEVVDGVFKSLCDAASAKVTQQAEAPVDLVGRRIWKMSLGYSLGSDAYIFDECIEKGYALHGYGELLDFSGCVDREQIYQRFVTADSSIAKDAYAVTAVSTFVLKMKIGDLVVVTEGNSKFRAIGEVTGDYRFLSREDQGDHYGQCRNVKWLRVYKPALPHDQLMNNKFSQMTLYELRPGAIDMDKLAVLLGTESLESIDSPERLLFQPGDVFGTGYKVIRCSPDLVDLLKPGGKHLPIAIGMLQTLANYVREGRLTLEDIKVKRVFDKVPETQLEPHLVNGYNNILPALVERVMGTPIRGQSNLQVSHTPSAKVLIIDEINRGNVSRILGELITLIEPSKRAGQPEALEVTLPYSKERFSVPANLYLIGTMNTADRSLAGLDIALRRRFSFIEMPPRPDLLDGVVIEGVNVGKLLRVMNERIELLFDRDHCLGHAYFMPLLETPTLEALGQIFRTSILPLLQEYFFEDWQRIQWVFNDHRKPVAHRFVNKPSNNLAVLFGEGVNVNEQSLRWKINEAAFGIPDAYAGVIGSAVVAGE